MKLTDFRCDCNTEDHTAWCQLTMCPAFNKGLVRWNPDVEELEFDPDYDPTELMTDDPDRSPLASEDFDTETFINMTMMARIEDAVDIWIARNSASPPNFSAFGCSWVWSITHAVWQAEPLGCYCGNITELEDLEFCDDCQVYRHGKGPWKQAQEGITEDVCRCEMPAKFVCIQCGVGRGSQNEPWHSLHAKQPATKLPPIVMCTHRGQHLALPDGLTIWASQCHTRKVGEPKPDYGVYLDKAWSPECIATLVPWPDFGIPGLSLTQLSEVIDNTRQLLRAGYDVEVGCIGGHGRTGTFLSCLIVAGGTPHTEAIKWVREKYCKKAVENKTQEWYVEAFYCFTHSIPLLTPIPPDDWKPLGGSFGAQTSFKFPFPYCKECEEPAGENKTMKCDKCGGRII